MRMVSPFNETHDVSTGDGGHLTLVNGRCFSIADGHGRILRPTDGTVFEDVRMLSHLVVSIAPTEVPATAQLLAVSEPTPFHHTIVTRPEPASVEGVPVETYIHRQWVGRGSRHDIEIHNVGDRPLVRTVTIELDTDFAHIFDVKSGTASGRSSEFTWDGQQGALVDPDDDALRVDVRADPRPDGVDEEHKFLSWTTQCPPRSVTVVSVGFEPVWDGRPAGTLFPLGNTPATSIPAQRHHDWHSAVPEVVTTDRRLAETFETSLADLASLRIFDPAPSRAHRRRRRGALVHDVVRP